MDLNRTLSEKLQIIMDKCNEAEKRSNAGLNQRFGKELEVFESTEEKTNNISKLYSNAKNNTEIGEHYSHIFCINLN